MSEALLRASCGTVAGFLVARQDMSDGLLACMDGNSIIDVERMCELTGVVGFVV